MAPPTDDSSETEGNNVVLFYDVLEQILLFLPVKSLLRFKSVSKQLRGLISDPRFAKQHVQHANHNFSRFHMSRSTRFSRDEPLDANRLAYLARDIAYESPEIPWTISLSSIYPSDSSRIQIDEMHNPFAVPVDKIHVLGSCNGLLFTVVANETFLCNPCIRERIKLPSQEQFWSPRNHCCVIAGLGYNAPNDEYKALVYFELCNELYIYSSRVGYWEKASHEFPGYGFIPDLYLPGIAVNGCPHWVVSNYIDHKYVPNRSRRIIIFFDVGDEKFKRVQTPEGWDDDYYECGSLGRFLRVNRRNEGQETLDVWIMKESVTTESWTMLFRIPVEQVLCRLFIPLGFTYDGEEVVLEIPDSKKIVSYNLVTGEEKFVMRSTCYIYPGFNSFQYANSLVSPSRFAIATKKKG